MQTRLAKRNQAATILLSKQVACLSRMTRSPTWNCEGWDSQATIFNRHKALHTFSEGMAAKPQSVFERDVLVLHAPSQRDICV
jgi:hypothetical protein